MQLSDEGEMDYEAIIEDLEARIRAGQAHVDAWETEKAEMLQAIEALRVVAARQGSKQMAFPFAAGSPSSSKPSTAVGTFRGLSYRDATRKVFGMQDRPLGAPDVADILYRAGYAKNRRTIKSNVDGAFKRLKDTGEIRKVDDTTTYVLAESNGNGSHG